MTEYPPYIFLAIIVGIALGTGVTRDWLPSLFFVLVAITLLVWWYGHWRRGMALVILIAFAGGGFWYGERALHRVESLSSQVDITEQIFRVHGVPEEKIFYQAVRLKPVLCMEGSCVQTGILWQAPLDEVFRPGERVLLACQVTIPENFDESFDYQMYLAKERIGYLCKEKGSFQRTESDWVSTLERYVYAPRFSFERALSTMYPEPEAGLAKGLLLGGNSYLSDAMKASFGRLGLSHIVAVSGYNIILIVQAILLGGIALGLWRKQAIGLSLGGVLFFIFIIGMPASAVRAGLMAGSAFGAFFLQRISYSFRAVLLAAVLMLVYQPLYLWYDAGFQLSFLATLAVIYAMHWYEFLVRYERVGKGLIELVWLTVAVQIFLWPILIYHFGYISWLSLVANILFLPLVPLAMLGSFIVGLIVLGVPGSTLLLSWIGYLPLTIITRGTEHLATLPWAVTESIHISLEMVILWYVLLAGMVWRGEIYRKRKKYASSFTCTHSHH